jgi:ABC-type Fe3+ transport system substrate-binding protein
MSPGRAWCRDDAARRIGTGLLRAAAAIAIFLVITLTTSCGKSHSGSGQTLELFIISPHGSDIRREFEQAFSKWHQKKFGTEVKIRWPDVGGTQNVIRDLEGSNSAKHYDLVFGGGSATFEQFRRLGLFQKPAIDKAVLARVPRDIFGTPLHGQGDLWIAATMSNFGINYNKDRERELGLTTPRVWKDLAGARWFGQLSLADPSKSGSVKTIYDQIFLQYGWENGWGVVTLMFANADNVRDSGSGPADDVGSAQAVAGVAIDFFGRKEILRVGEDLIGFVVPQGGSVTDPDPIAMLKGAPHAQLAAQFIEFVISEEGQKLWVFRPGTPGGPVHYMLGRLSVLPEIYTRYAQYLFDPANPFAAAEPLKGNERETSARSSFMGELVKAALIDNHEDLVAARRAILAAGDPPDLLAKLIALPTFIPTHVKGDRLEDDPERPITAADQEAVANEFKPSAPRTNPAGQVTDPPNVAHDKKVKLAEAPRLSNRLIDLWREHFRTRFRELRAEAESRRKKR